MMASLIQTVSLLAGITYEFHHVPPLQNQSTTILFLHGFPSSLHSWRHQIEHFSRLGYGCLTPNLMGYGKTYSPLEYEEYRMKQMVLHLVALLAHLKIETPVIVVGHDFGTVLATRFTLHEPARVKGLVLLNIGYGRPGPLDIDRAIEMSRLASGYEVFGYWRFFAQDPDAADIIEKNAESFLDIGFPPSEQALDLWRANFTPTGQLKQWLIKGTRLPKRASYLTDIDYHVYLGYLLEGMRSKLNWYKSRVNNVDRDDEKDLDPYLKTPCLFLAATRDAVAIPELFSSQKEFINDLTVKEIDSTHWMMEEKVNEVNEAIQQWIHEKF